MRVLFTAWGWASHYFPLVPLAWACRSAGHEVCVASQPQLTPTILESGLPTRPVGHEADLTEIFDRLMAPLVKMYSEGYTEEQRRGLRTMPFRLFSEVAWSMGDDLIELARKWRPDIVVYEPTAYAGLLAASAIDVPAVRHLWGADSFYYAKDAERQVLPEYLFGKYGLPEIDGSGALTLDAYPPSMQIAYDCPSAPVRFIPYNGSGSAPRDLPDVAPGRHRVCLTWATIASHIGEDMFALPEMATALSTVPDVELVVMVTPAQRERLGELPGNVQVLVDVPLNHVLPTCSAFVHQGGVGSVMTALSYGIPQLVIPQIPDQKFAAQSVTDSGAGNFVPLTEANTDTLGRAIGSLLHDPSYRDTANEKAAEIAKMATPADIVSTLELLAAGASGTSASAGER